MFQQLQCILLGKSKQAIKIFARDNKGISIICTDKEDIYMLHNSQAETCIDIKQKLKEIQNVKGERCQMIKYVEASANLQYSLFLIFYEKVIFCLKISCQFTDRDEQIEEQNHENNFIFTINKFEIQQYIGTFSKYTNYILSQVKGWQLVLGIHHISKQILIIQLNIQNETNTITMIGKRSLRFDDNNDESLQILQGLQRTHFQMKCHLEYLIVFTNIRYTNEGRHALIIYNYKQKQQIDRPFISPLLFQMMDHSQSYRLLIDIVLPNHIQDIKNANIFLFYQMPTLSISSINTSNLSTTIRENKFTFTNILKMIQIDSPSRSFEQQINNQGFTFILFTKEGLINNPKIKLLTMQANKLDFVLSNQIQLPDLTFDISKINKEVYLICPLEIYQLWKTSKLTIYNELLSKFPQGQGLWNDIEQLLK